MMREAFPGAVALGAGPMRAARAGDAASFGSVLAEHWWVFAARGGISVALGLVVLLLPGLGRLILGHILAFQGLAVGALLLFAFHRVAFSGPMSLDPFRAEAALGIAVAVAIGDFGHDLRLVAIPLLAGSTVLGGAMLLAGAARQDVRPWRGWLALLGLTAVAAGVALGAAAAGIAFLPGGEAWLLGDQAIVFGQTAAVLTAWYPAYAIASGLLQMALSARLLVASWPASMMAAAKETTLAASALPVAVFCMLTAYTGVAGAVFLAAAALWPTVSRRLVLRKEAGGQAARKATRCAITACTKSSTKRR